MKRDEENQETLALTLRGLRAEAARTTLEVDRLNAQNADLKRQLSLTGATTRAAHNASQAAEASARALKEELGRVKTLLVQVRQQCATDVRKRDLQLQKLKTHLASHQRGSNKAAVIAPSIAITGGPNGRSRGSGASKEKDAAPSVQDVAYTLTQETTEFLTQLSQSLSDENDSLIGLVRGTLVTLKDLMGMPHNQSRVIRGGSRHGSSGPEDDAQDNLVQVLPTSIDVLGTDLEALLTKLRDLLTNPSFAPVEEVHVRDEEIQRLREGWMLMESRWREAVCMMQGWRKRMLDSGDTVNLEDLRMGLDLGQGMEGVNEHIRTEEHAQETDEDVSDREIEGEEDLEEPSVSGAVDLPANRHLFGDCVPILQEVNGNAKPLPPPNLRKVSFQSPIAIENARLSSPVHSTEDLSLDELALSSPPLPRPTPSPQKQPRLRTAASTPSLRTPRSAPRLTVNEKLQRAETEARRRRQDKSTPVVSRSAKTTPLAETASSSPLIFNAMPAVPSEQKARVMRQGVADPPALPAASPVKRTGIVGKPQRRRKSTLSPDELAALMGLRAQEDEEEDV